MWLSYIVVIILAANYGHANKTVADYSEDDDDMHTMALGGAERKCCSGVSYQIDANPNYECCGTLLYDRTSKTCCNDTIHNSKLNFQCCGIDYYNPNDGLCCPAYFLGVNKSVNFSPEIVNDEEAKKNTQCCGLRLYDKRNQICCKKMRDIRQLFSQFPRSSDIKGVFLSNDLRFDHRVDYALLATWDLGRYYASKIRFTPIYNIHSRKFTNTVCCNGDAIDGDVETNCTNRNVRARFFNRTGFQSHFGNHRYYEYSTALSGYCIRTKFDLLNQLCCVVEIKNDNNETKVISKIQPKTTSTTACCGLRTYDFDTEICCNDKVFKQNGEGSLGCCGGEAYDESNESCTIQSSFSTSFENQFYLNSCIKTTPNDMCCGNQAFNNQNESCCQSLNPLTLELESLLHTDIISDSSVIRCCGTDVYNWSNETCCGSKVYPKVTYPNTCCGNAIYNPDMHVCCNDTVFEVDRNEFSCCGFSLYSRDSQFCCNGKLYAFTDNAGQLNCCLNKQLYDHRKQICCNSVLSYSTGIAKMLSCC